MLCVPLVRVSVLLKLCGCCVLINYYFIKLIGAFNKAPLEYRTWGMDSK